MGWNLSEFCCADLKCGVQNLTFLKMAKILKIFVFSLF